MSNEIAEVNSSQETTATEELAPKQAAALQSLLLGQTVTAAAQSAGVDRRTLHRWLSGDRAFRAAFRQGRRECRQAVACSLERMAHNAVVCLNEAIFEGNVNAALHLLKGIRALRPAAWRNGGPAKRRRRGETDREDAR